MIFSTFGLFRQKQQLHSLLGKRPAHSILFWGNKHPKRRALARLLRLPVLNLEDGFLRSEGLGVEGWPSYSYICDDIGIYYDTTRPSRLEHLILQNPTDPEILKQAQQAIDALVHNKLSKYNHAPDTLPAADSSRPIVLVIDQTLGDMAVTCGQADEHTFQTMFQTALAENPEAEIWIKTHPDVLSGKKQGYLTHTAQHKNVRLIAQDLNPIALLQRADKIYCVTSHMGFEALMCGKPVTTFGLPWYAGWGICDDRHPDTAKLAAQGRRQPRTLHQLFAAAYLQYSLYLDPDTNRPGTLSDVIRYLAAARQRNDKLRGEIHCIGMSLWKRAVIKPFFRTPSCRLKFAAATAQLDPAELTRNRARLLAWGNGKQQTAEFAHRHNIPLLRMEDGFIRSVGLGSNLVPPLSLVIDDIGIYFNPETPSRLEYILQNHPFDQQDRQAALHLQKTLTENHISKYNVGNPDIPQPPTDKTVILVPGQVEDDASIRHGSPDIRSNLALLKTVRAQNPDAHIIYKPHPDVVSGNRIGHIPPEESARYADQTLPEADILACLQHADEVHTMTSLTGFEALLRGKKVHCYGQPFYAGWGLTQDHLPIPRRNRQLRLWQLIAGTLIHYPDYIHPETRRPISADTAAGILKQQKNVQKNNNRLHSSFLSKQTNKIKQLYLSLTR